jgi:outer membrane protein insertion porin family
VVRALRPSGRGSRQRVRLRKGALTLKNVRSPLLLLLLLLSGAGVSAQDSTTVASANFEGRIVARIDFEPPNQPLPRDELDRLLPLRAGSPLHAGEVHQALQNLFETGRFADVSIDAEPAPGPSPGAVILRISTTLNYFVGGVGIDGVNDPPNRSQMLTASKLELGTPFAESQAAQAVENMQERLRANGLYRAKLRYELERNPSTEEASIHFQLDAGGRARFDGVLLSGAFQRSPAAIIKSTRWRRGFGPILFPGWRQVTENRIETGLDRVRRDFQNNNRLQVRVTLDKLDYHDKTNTVTPTLVIDNGPIIEVRTLGANVSRGRLRQLIPIYQERTVDRSLLQEGSRNLANYFQAQGFFDVAVDFNQITSQPGVQEIDYSILRNARHKLAGIEIQGNKFFDMDTIRERLTMREAGVLRYRYGRYSSKMRDDGRDAIRDLYRANGFRDMRVTAVTLDDYRGRKDEIGVRFEIQEGAQSFVNQLAIEGASDEDTGYLRGILRSAEGQSFSETNLAADRDTILGFYFNNGYPDAAFDWSQTPSPEPNRLDLRYVIRPGERQFVRDVLVRGLETTRPGVVSSRIRIRPGDAISQSRIAETQQKLYDLGIFSKVQTALQNPDGKEESKYVLFQLDEANKYSFNVGIGAELARIGGGVTTFDAPAGTTGFSPRISLGVNRLNFLGIGHTVGLQTLASTLEQRAIASYQEPQFMGNENLALTFSALFDTAKDVRTFAARRWEGSVQLAQRLSRVNSLQYRFAFRQVTIDKNSLKISKELVPLLSQPVRVGLASMSYVQDRRDNPTDSHRGIYNTVDVGIALPQFGSVTDYARLVFRNSTYHPLSRDVVIARTLQFGYIQRLGGTPEIPLGERFFAGGASSHRGFPDNQAGPRDLETGFPLGGNAMLFHSTELRFPLIGENVGGVLFHDMGNVYSSIDQISFRYRQGSYQEFNYMVQAVGFGIRYRTPVGPIRVDFSYSPNSPRFVGFSGTRDELLSCNPNLPSQNPVCVGVPQRINTFQFHFSLGQTF